jgi:hypothetical protein
VTKAVKMPCASCCLLPFHQAISNLTRRAINALLCNPSAVAFESVVERAANDAREPVFLFRADHAPRFSGHVQLAVEQ